MTKKLFVLLCLMFSCCSLHSSLTSVAAAQDPQKKTVDNLMEAYNDESNAIVRYEEFAKKADEEGYGAVASLFRATSRAEQIYQNHYALALKGFGDSPQADIETPAVFTTKMNLESAINGEPGEPIRMYADFQDEAKRDGIESAEESFKEIGAAKAAHRELYKTALTELAKWKNLTKEFFICPECGNVETTRPAGVCPICGEPAENFISVK